MSCIGSRPRLFISHGPKKKILPDPDPDLGNLTPDVHSDTLTFLKSSDSKDDSFLKLGKYVLFRQNEKSDAYVAINTTTQEELTCKVCCSVVYEFVFGENVEQSCRDIAFFSQSVIDLYNTRLH